MNQETNNPSNCPICGKPTHKESKYCIFHASGEEKNEREFKKALKEYVDKIKKEDGDYAFEKFIFIGDIDFKKDFNIEIFKNANFSKASFEGIVNFAGIKFYGFAYFIGTFFKGIASFTEVTFEGNSIFTMTNFHGDANFTTTIFNGEADFKSTNFESFTRFNYITFNGAADFREATFEMNTVFNQTFFMNIADFEDVKFNGHTTEFARTTFAGKANYFVVKFKGNADFNDATFIEDAYFEKATFEGDANFRLKKFVKILDFSKIKTFSGKKLFIKLNNEEGKIFFNRASLENIYLDIELVRGILIDFTDVLLRNTKVKKGQIESHILQEKEKKFSEAREIYLLLKNNFHSIGHYNDESWAFKKEKDMERKNYCHFRTLHQWLWYCFLNAIFGYGEKPWNAILSAGILIFAFALLFSNIGIGNPEIIELNGTAIQQNSGNIVDLASKGLIKNNVIRNFPDSLYFSLITFTTLGYGDFRPLEGIGRILAGSEAFIGAFMMALFVYTFARRTGGR